VRGPPQSIYVKTGSRDRRALMVDAVGHRSSLSMLADGTAWGEVFLTLALRRPKYRRSCGRDVISGFSPCCPASRGQIPLRAHR
jgi:hypothetical protein